MRCSCQQCGTYMVHNEELSLGCVCPECNNRCTACLGTDSVLSPEQIKENFEVLLSRDLDSGNKSSQDF